MDTTQHTIITGGGSGLGLGLALRLLRRGGDISVLDLGIQPQARARLDAAATDGGGAWQHQQTDIRDQAQVSAAVGRAVEAFGPPALAINSAGVGLCRAVSDMRGEDFHRVIDINLNGSFNFAAAVLPTLAPGARLALVASLAGLTSNYAYSAYGASKFGVVGLARALRYEYAGRGIGISCICPPEVDTPLVHQERASGDPIGLSIKDIAGCLDPDTACDGILKGLDAGRWMIIPGVQARLTALAVRHTPVLFDAFIQLLVRRGRRRLQLQEA